MTFYPNDPGYQPRVLLLGGTSEIGLAIVAALRLPAAAEVILAGRDEQRLAAAAKELQAQELQPQDLQAEDLQAEDQPRCGPSLTTRWRPEATRRSWTAYSTRATWTWSSRPRAC